MNIDHRIEGTGPVTSHSALSLVQRRRAIATAALVIASVIAFSPCFAAAPDDSPDVLGIPVDFILFASTLIGVGLFHHHLLAVAPGVLVAISATPLESTVFQTSPGLADLSVHFGHEDVISVDCACAEARAATHGPCSRRLHSAPPVTLALLASECKTSDFPKTSTAATNIKIAHIARI